MSAWSSESPTTRQVGQWVGCEDDDGLIVVHPERETCAVCQQASPVSTSAESPANTPVAPAGASEPPSEQSIKGAAEWVLNVMHGCGRAGGEPEPGEHEAALEALRLAMAALVSPVEPTPEPPTEKREMLYLPPSVTRRRAEKAEAMVEQLEGNIARQAGFMLAQDEKVVALQAEIERLSAKYNDAHLRALKAEAGAPAPCVWRDIASAPKDETPIRLKWAGTTVEAIGRWCPAQVLPSGFGRSNYSDDWRDVEGDDVLLLPTHWKPVIVSGSPLKVER